MLFIRYDSDGEQLHAFFDFSSRRLTKTELKSAYLKLDCLLALGFVIQVYKR